MRFLDTAIAVLNNIVVWRNWFLWLYDWYFCPQFVLDTYENVGKFHNAEWNPLINVLTKVLVAYKFCSPLFLFGKVNRRETPKRSRTTNSRKEARDNVHRPSRVLGLPLLNGYTFKNRHYSKSKAFEKFWTWTLSVETSIRFFQLFSESNVSD